MTADRIHRAVSADGTVIAGRVQGQGPPLVLVHAPVHDGDIAWEALLPLLADRFTCYLPSLRGRGLSGDNPDHSPPRSHFQEDVNTFVGSIGEPVYLMGWSDGGSLALGAAAHSDAVAAVAVYEPAVWTLMRENDLARFGAAIKQQREATADGRLLDAAYIFHQFVYTDDEFTALDADYLDRQARLFPLLLQEIQQGMSDEGPQPTDPEVLEQIGCAGPGPAGPADPAVHMVHRFGKACRPARRRPARPRTTCRRALRAARRTRAPRQGTDLLFRVGPAT